MLYWMLSGRLPFRGTPMEMLAAKATVGPPPLDVEGLDPALEAAVGRLIAKEPYQRFALAGQARRALEVHATPLKITDDWKSQLFASRARFSKRAPMPTPWSPPGADTLEQAWPTLVIAPPVPQVAQALPGREAVLRSIEAVAIRVERGDLGLISVLGESGMGKTVVLEHVAANLLEQGRFLVIRAPYFAGSTQAGGVRRGIERMLGVSGMNRVEVRGAVERLLSRYDDVFPEEVDQLIESLRPSGPVTPDELSSHLAEHMMVISRLFRRLSQTRPLLLLIDDADCASPDLARFLEFMLLEARYDRWPMMVLCSVDVTAAGGSFWRAVMASDVLRGESHSRIQLHPVPLDALAMELMPRHGLTQGQARRIAKWSSGNPLHAAYLSEYLISENKLLDSSSDISLGSGARLMPSALLDLMKLKLKAELAKIPDARPVTSLLETMAVLGQASSEDLVQAMLPDADRSNYERILDTVLENGLVGIMDHSEPLVLGFTPALIRDAVLAGIGKERMIALHLKAVDVCMELDPGRIRSHWGAMGDHHAAAGQMQAASECWLKGMYFELGKGNAVRGVSWGRQAIAQLDASEPQTAFTTLLVAAMAFDAGESATAESLMRSVLEAGDVDRRLQAGDLLCDLLENQGNAQEWAKLIEDMSKDEEAAGDVGRCALYCARSMWLGSVGRPLEGLAEAQRALSLAQPGPPAQRAAQRLAFAYLPQMQLDAALNAAKRSVYEAAEVPLLQARSLRVLGLVQLWQQNPIAVKTLESIPALCRSRGLMTRFPIALHDQADAYRLNNEVAQATEKYEETIALCEGLPLTSLIVLCRFKLVMCDILEGRYGTVFDRLSSLVPLGLKMGLGSSARFAALLRGWVRAVQGEVGPALIDLEEVGGLDTIMVDPQIPRIINEVCDHLVDNVLSSSEGFIHSTGVADVLRQARDVYGISGDTDRLQRIERLLQRLPRVPR
jgi:hypothetical protein